MAARDVIESLEIAAALRVVRAYLADQAVAHCEELGAAVEQALAGARMVEGHRPLDRDLIRRLDQVLAGPDRVQVLYAERRVLRDRPRADVRLAARVVVHRVLGEVAGDAIRIARVQVLVVGQDALGRAHRPYERPITSSMISSVPAPIRLRRMSRQTRSTPYSFM